MDKQPLDSLYETRVEFPDPDYLARFEALIGIDEAKQSLSRLLRVLLLPNELRDWQKKHYPDAQALVDTVLARPPFVILSGDVGTGKTELATTIGARIASLTKKQITMFPISLSTRGEGRVGEMTKLISDAFARVYEESKRLQNGDGATGGNILLIDEADTLAQSRETSQMHHEDRAGVNALIRGIDRIASSSLPAAVIMCTNRIGSMDPAVLRRAAEIFTFIRPNQQQRLAVLSVLAGVQFTPDQIKSLSELNGSGDNNDGFTYSDLKQRYIPSLVMKAFPDRKITFKEAAETLSKMSPTPPFSSK